MARRLEIATRTRIDIRRDTHTRDFAAYLASRLATTRAHALSFIEDGRVRLNGAVTGPVAMPMRGDVIEVDFPPEFTAHMRPREIPVAILFMDAWIVAVDKPAGIVVHPARGHMTGYTVLNGLMHALRDTVPEGEQPYLAVSHRIDRDTSGIVLYARDTATHQALARQFQERLVGKTYLAIVDGTPGWDTFTVEAPIGRDVLREGLWNVVAPDAPDAKAATTRLTVKERLGDVTLVEAAPLTGRTHQIRLHLRHAGFPICGDADYHPRASAAGMARQALHAAELTVTHPATGAPLTLASPLPEDMQALLARYRTP